MRKIHIQCRTSLMKIAAIARGMHSAGLYVSRPSDVVNAALDAAARLFKAEPFTHEEDAERYLNAVGFRSPSESERAILDAMEKRMNSRDKIENLIEQVRRSPSTSDEIKEMLNQSVGGEIHEKQN